MVHADAHLANIMVRYDPPTYVLIDIGGTAGECIYPLALGFGAPGRGGDLHRPPRENASRPGRTIRGDYLMIIQEVLGHKCWRDTASGLPCPRSFLAIVGTSSHSGSRWPNVAQPPWPASIFPGDSWIESALNPTVLVQAGLIWDREGNINTATTVFADPADQQGNDDGHFRSEHKPEGAPQIGLGQHMPGSTSAAT